MIVLPTAARHAWTLSAALTGIWLVVVTISGIWDRVLDHWVSALTMLGGSFLAGSSPEGGGAVAFPVFTKALEVPTEVARSFGLCIQAVGMTVAAVAILVSRRTVHTRAVVVGSIAGVTGFLGTVAVVGEHDRLFWPTSIGAGWTKATFSIVLATTSVMMIHHLRHGPHPHSTARWTIRHDIGLLAMALAGGALSALAGTGANIVVFLFLVVLADVSAGVALPSAVIVMALVSMVGFALFGLVDGQLFVELSGDRVVGVGGLGTDLPADRNDLLGLWLAAVPVVVWGAPLGSWVAHQVRDATLVGFVALLAAVEVATTFVLVDEIRDDPAMLTFLVAGLALMPVALIALRRHRHVVFAASATPSG